MGKRDLNRRHEWKVSIDDLRGRRGQPGNQVDQSTRRFHRRGILLHKGGGGRGGEPQLTVGRKMGGQYSTNRLSGGGKE